MLWTENYWSGSGNHRYFDIAVEGTQAVDEMDPRAVTGEWTQPQHSGAVYSYEFVAPTDTVAFAVNPGDSSYDNNPILNGFLLEDVTPTQEPGDAVPEPAGLGAVALALLAVRRRRR